MTVLLFPREPHSHPRWSHKQAQGIIHMGATSCFVGDNTDIVQLKEGMVLLHRKLVKLLAQMKTFAGACVCCIVVIWVVTNCLVK